MKVIVAGLPKTGTKSVNAALKKLGYDVYDFVEHMYYLEKEWDEIFHQQWSSDKFYDMYKDVDVAIDMPASFFWEEIHKVFPDAKIILTVRDSEEVWMRSLRNHFHLLDSHFLGRMLQIIEAILQRKAGMLLTTSYKEVLGIERTLFGRKTFLNESLLKMRYRAHNAHVQQNAPSNKLLVFNCREGWEPLCKFLELPTPDETFPHENIRGAVIEDTAKRHPVAQVYKKEISVALIKLLAKISLACLSVAFIVNMFS